MNTLFHSDLLNFGTIVLIVMIGGGILVVLRIIGDSAWRILRRTDRQDEQADALGSKPDEHEGEHLPKSA